MADGSLIFDTKLDGKGFKDGMDKLKSTGATAMKAVATATVATVTAIAGIGIAATKVGSGFEKSMSQVAATMGLTVEQIRNGDKSFQALEKAAMDAGASTMFTASQSAEALNYLALAGYDAEKSIEALPTVLNLAAAGGLDLGYASDLVTDSMSALGLEMDQLEGFTDELAKTSQKSNTSVGQLGEAILTVGGTAKVLAGGTVELNTVLGVLADNGIKGAEGGTALRNVMLALTAPTDKAAAAMKGLGVEAYDADGNLRPLPDIFGDLNGALEGMTEGEKTEVLSSIFNKVDLKSVNALLGTSAERFEDLAAEIENADGAAADMAETMMDNLQGQITILGSALEGLGIKIYKEMDSPLKDVATTLVDYVDEIAKTITAHDDIKASAEELGMTAEELGYDLSTIPNGLEGAAQILGEILADMLQRIVEFAPELLNAASNLILSFIDGIRQNQDVLVEGTIELLTAMINVYMDILEEVFVLGAEIIGNLVLGIAEKAPELIERASELILNVLNAIIEQIPNLIDAGFEIVIALIDGIVEMLPELMTMALDIVLAIAEGISDNLPKLIESASEMITTLIDGMGEIIPDLIDVGMEIVETVMEAIIDNVDTLVDAAVEIIDALIEFITDNLDTLINFQIELIMAIVEGLIDNLDKLIDAALDIVDALVDGLLDNLNLLIDAAIELVLAIVEGLIQNLPKLVNAAIKLVLGIVDGLIRALPQLIGAGVKLIMEFIGAIVRLIPQLISLGIQLVGELALAIVKAVPRLITAARSIAKSALSALSEAFSGIGQIGLDLVKGLWNGINNAKDWVLGKISGFGSSIMDGIKGIFGIRSPSKVMQDEVGKMLVVGMADGIEKNQKVVERTTKKMSKAVMDIMDTFNKDAKKENDKHNKEIAKLEKRAKEDIQAIHSKAAKANRSLTETEKIKIQRITEDSTKKVNDLEEKAAKEREKIAKDNSKELISIAEKYVEDKKWQGEMSVYEEGHFWYQMYSTLETGSEEYEKALANHQAVVKGFRSEMEKINDDYAKKIADIDKNLVDETNKLNEEYNKAYEDRVNSLLNFAGLFDKFVKEETIFGQDLIRNLETQVKALDDYGIVIEDLENRIKNVDLISELKQLGPKSLAELEALSRLSDGELAEFVALYEEKFRLATTQAGKELEPLKTNTENQIDELNTAAQTELEKVEEDWVNAIENIVNGTEKEFDQLYFVGQDAIQGLVDGMSSMESPLKDAATNMADTVSGAIKDALDIKSPSRLMRLEVGKMIPAGIAEGFTDGIPDLQRDIDREMAALTSKMKTTVDLETQSVSRGMTADNRVAQRVVENINDNNGNNDDNTTITGNTFVIREEADIKKVAVELYNLKQSKLRGKGRVVTT